MKVSIILIGYNSWHFLEKNLLSLSFLKERPDAEIIYIDNASTDETISKIKEHYPYVCISTNSQNEGVSKARNQGLKRAQGEYIWILDSDTEVNEEAFNQMIAFMDSSLDAGMCGCKMYGQDGSIQESCRPFPSIKGKIAAGLNIILKKMNISIKQAVVYNKNQDSAFIVDYIIGACQLIRKKAQQEVGLLDENIFYGPEDADFCLRMKRAGYNVYYLPQVSIYHAYQRISSQYIFSKINLKHLQGLAYYFWKYRKEKA